MTSNQHHKATTTIAKSAGRVVGETLNVASMIGNVGLPGQAGVQVWLVRRRAREGGPLVCSAKLCSRCRWKKDVLTLSERAGRWQNCGILNQRDANAARNLELWPGFSF